MRAVHLSIRANSSDCAWRCPCTSFGLLTFNIILLPSVRRRYPTFPHYEPSRNTTFSSYLHYLTANLAGASLLVLDRSCHQSTCISLLHRSSEHHRLRSPSHTTISRLYLSFYLTAPRDITPHAFKVMLSVYLCTFPYCNAPSRP